MHVILERVLKWQEMKAKIKCGHFVSNTSYFWVMNKLMSEII